MVICSLKKSNGITFLKLIHDQSFLRGDEISVVLSSFQLFIFSEASLLKVKLFIIPNIHILPIILQSVFDHRVYSSSVCPCKILQGRSYRIY